MDLSEFAQKFPRKMQEVTNFIEGDGMKTIMAEEAIAHFEESFQNEGFTDEEAKPWDDVERRDKESPWYGHSGQTGKFSAARTTARILTGETKTLQGSFGSQNTDTGVKITNNAPYARVHQFGLQARIYGSKLFTMIARPFMGPSRQLKRNIENKGIKEIINIIKRK